MHKKDDQMTPGGCSSYSSVKILTLNLPCFDPANPGSLVQRLFHFFRFHAMLAL